jgi:hypothetical protein
MLQGVTITNNSNHPILVVPLDMVDGEPLDCRADVETHVLPGRSAVLLVHELRYLCVYAQPGERPEPAPDLRIEVDDLEVEELDAGEAPPDA